MLERIVRSGRGRVDDHAARQNEAVSIRAARECLLHDLAMCYLCHDAGRCSPLPALRTAVPCNISGSNQKAARRTDDLASVGSIWRDRFIRNLGATVHQLNSAQIDRSRPSFGGISCISFAVGVYFVVNLAQSRTFRGVANLGPSTDVSFLAGADSTVRSVRPEDTWRRKPSACGSFRTLSSTPCFSGVRLDRSIQPCHRKSTRPFLNWCFLGR